MLTWVSRVSIETYSNAILVMACNTSDAASSSRLTCTRPPSSSKVEGWTCRDLFSESDAYRFQDYGRLNSLITKLFDLLTLKAHDSRIILRLGY